MDEINDSELTKVTSNAFNNVLQYVQNSCLNFHIQMTPFSADISLKKSLVRNKSGFPMMPNLPKHDECGLDMELVRMKKKYEDLASKHTLAMDTIKSLEKGVKMRDETISKLLLLNEETQPVFTDKKSNNYEEEKIEPLNALNCEMEVVKVKDDFVISSQDDDLTQVSKPYVPMPSGQASDSSTVACSLCSRAMINYSPQYFSGYKLHPACVICLKRDSLIDEEPDPFSSFPSSSIPSSLLTHWIQPYQLSFSPPISASVSLKSHYVKLPNPVEILYTAQDILLELKELMKRSDWWS